MDDTHSTKQLETKGVQVQGKNAAHSLTPPSLVSSNDDVEEETSSQEDLEEKLLQTLEDKEEEEAKQVDSSKEVAAPTLIRAGVASGALDEDLAKSPAERKVSAETTTKEKVRGCILYFTRLSFSWDLFDNLFCF